MSGPFKELVKIRENLKKRIPTFMRVNASRYKKLQDRWRRQRGRHNKIRKSIKGAGNKPSIGYGTPSHLKHIHPSGYKEVLVRCVKDLENIDPSKECIRISSQVGLRKRIEILKIAKERNIHVLNPNIIARVRDKGYKSVREFFESLQRSERQEKEKGESP